MVLTHQTSVGGVFQRLPRRESIGAFALKTPWPDGTRHISCCLRWNCWRDWPLWSSRLGSISSVITGSWRPVPVPVTHRAGRAGCRAVGGGRLSEHSILRPSAAVGDPAGAGVFLRPQRMRGLWRTTADRRGPDRSGLDPDLSGGGRAAGVAPARAPSEPRFEFAVCLLDPSPGVRLGVPHRSLRPRMDPDYGPTGNQTGLRLGRKTGKRSLGELPDPCGALCALTESPKRCLIFPILSSPPLFD